MGLKGTGEAARGTWRSALVALPGATWLVLFTLVPVALMLLASFWTSDMFGLKPSWTLRNWERLVKTPLYAELLFKTFRIAVVTTALTLIFAYPLALFLARLQGAAKATLVIPLFLPFWIGYVVRTFAWLPILGRNGLINQALMGLGLASGPIDWFLYNEGAVYVGLIYVYLLFMVLPIFLSLDRIDPSLIEAAADLHASPWAIFRQVLFPLSLPGVLSGSVMVFLLAFGAYVTPALLGGPSGIMFSNVVATQFIADNNWAFGSALSLVMMAVVLGVLFLAGRKIGLQRIFLAGRGH
jgi:spermidine/putrescine transport system permease protein